MTPHGRLAPTRRGFLGLAGASAAFAALGGLRSLPAAAADPGAPAGRFFSPADAEVLTQVVERLVETGEPGAPPVRATGAVATIDRLCAGLDPGLTSALPWLLRLVEWGPWLFEATPSRFTRLEPAAKDASLRGWSTSRLGVRRAGFQALRNLACLGYWSQPETWPLIGYAGPLLAGRRAGEPGP
jgi:hypothetical protein